MALTERLIHFKKKEDFQKEYDSGNISETSIVFIKDSGEIWTHNSGYKTIPGGGVDGQVLIINDDGELSWGNSNGIELTDEDLLELEPGNYWAKRVNHCSNKPSPEITGFYLQVIKTSESTKRLILYRGNSLSNHIWSRDYNEEWGDWIRYYNNDYDVVCKHNHEIQKVDGELRADTLRGGEVWSNEVKISGEIPRLSSINNTLRVNAGGIGTIFEKGDIYLYKDSSIRFYYNSQSTVDGEDKELIMTDARINSKGFQVSGGTGDQIFTRDGNYKTLGKDLVISDIVVKPLPNAYEIFDFEKSDNWSINEEVHRIDFNEEGTKYDNVRLLEYNNWSRAANILYEQFTKASGLLYNNASGPRYIYLQLPDKGPTNDISYLDTYICIRTTSPNCLAEHRITRIDGTMEFEEIPDMDFVDLKDGSYIYYTTTTIQDICRFKIDRMTFTYAIYLCKDKELGEGIYKKNYSNPHLYSLNTMKPIGINTILNMF